ncbi:MAG TPA: ATP-NAD kinase [Tepidanaerobacter syntrophicus]|uniref:ATP-NAD kinase family protein n=1 Tax=Tepidanaerobacter syntrophicus TaxID=224999 RepID=UPI00175AEBC1|nr:NAD(+)/NADH kinase [Tepidanaerobacter syntrophicus]HHV82194.1 ATP-NAD kinase [Tepidanaerobacter syntrophicus]
MTSIGIIANPASGKDIRRLVSHATVIDNNEKVNIVERIILAAQHFGVDNIYIMPDTFHIGLKAIDALVSLKQLKCNVEMIDQEITYGIEDTIKATREMEKIGVGCIVSLGGDGTNRGIAKAIGDTPLLPISTGTNNVYPEMIEGTLGGMAAAITASKKYDLTSFCDKDKRIEIYKNGEMLDIALIDAVVSKENFVGSRAIWDISTISDIFVTRAHPWSIGLSSIAGCFMKVLREDEFGLHARIGDNGGKVVSAPISAGVIRDVSVLDYEKMYLSKKYLYIMEFTGTLALDGEREIFVKKGQKLNIKVARNGPLRVDAKKALEIAQESGFFVKE